MGFTTMSLFTVLTYDPYVLCIMGHLFALKQTSETCFGKYRFVNHLSMICDIKARELFKFNVVSWKTFKLHMLLMLCTH